MRKQAKELKITLKKGLENAKRRKQAASLLKLRKEPFQEIARATKVNKSTHTRTNRYLESNEEAALKMAAEPRDGQNMLSTVLSVEEEA